LRRSRRAGTSCRRLCRVGAAAGTSRVWSARVRSRPLAEALEQAGRGHRLRPPGDEPDQRGGEKLKRGEPAGARTGQRIRFGHAGSPAGWYASTTPRHPWSCRGAASYTAPGRWASADRRDVTLSDSLRHDAGDPSRDALGRPVSQHTAPDFGSTSMWRTNAPATRQPVRVEAASVGPAALQDIGDAVRAI